MGVCASSETPEQREKRLMAEKVNKTLENEMHQQQQQEHMVNKLLLLGAGESGKSTLFKQMIKIYGQGFSYSERKSFAPVVYSNIIASVETLSEMSIQYGEPETQKGIEAKKYIDSRLDVKSSEDLFTPEMALHFKNFWADPGIKRTYDHRNEFQLNDSTEYFLNQVEVIGDPEYVPSEEDVLRSRVRTTGIVENNFVIEGNHFRMFDVGGQRNERKKWLHCFENVTAVLFVAAISEFNQVLFENENVNRMVEALNLFEEICNSRWFERTSMILFLNKRDIFEHKLLVEKRDLRECFPHFDPDSMGEGTLTQRAIEFLEDEFLKRNHLEKTVYAHTTCATDTTNVTAVFNAVKDIIIRTSLADAGLV
jgi:GTPase SAR1 family protein